MSKILLAANDNKTIYNFRRELIARLIADGHEIVVSVPEDKNNVEFEKMGCKIAEIPLSRRGANPLEEVKLISKYKRMFKELSPDVVLTYTVKPNIYASLACKSLKIPYICNVTGLGSVFQGESLMKKVISALQKLAYKKAECVFFQNSDNMEYFAKGGIVSGKTRLLPGSGVNLELHKLTDYPDDSECIRFIFVSRIRQDKGFNELADAISQISTEHKNVQFHIVGYFEEESFREKLKELEENFPVIFYGGVSQEQVHEIEKSCHCLIHPSYHEGMSNVLLEAAASGKPCLCSDIPGCAEAVEDGVTGFLFKVRDSASIVQAIEKFLLLSHEQRKEMGLKGREKMEREFDRNIVINAYREELNKLLKADTKEQEMLLIKK